LDSDDWMIVYNSDDYRPHLCLIKHKSQGHTLHVESSELLEDGCVEQPDFDSEWSVLEPWINSTEHRYLISAFLLLQEKERVQSLLESVQFAEDALKAHEIARERRRAEFATLLGVSTSN